MVFDIPLGEFGAATVSREVAFQSGTVEAGDGVLRRPRLRTRPEPRKDVQPDAVPPAHIVPGGRHHGFHHQRDEQIRGAHQRQTLEAALCDADDGNRMPVDIDRTVQCGWIAAEPALPIVVTQHHIRFAAFELIFIGSKQAAQGWRHSQNVEVVA